MALPDGYTAKPGLIPAYFDAILTAEAPDRFSTRFMEELGFKSTNHRLKIGVLKELGFLLCPSRRLDRVHVIKRLGLPILKGAEAPSTSHRR